MRSESLVVTFPGMTVGSVHSRERDNLWQSTSGNLLPGPETEMLWTVSEGSRQREARSVAGLCATNDNSS